MRYQYKSILVKLADGVAVAKLNMHSTESMVGAEIDVKRELANFLTRAKADNQVKAIVITGKDGTFFTGGDLKASCIQGKDSGHNGLSKRQDIAGLIRELGKPVIAAVNGYAIGAGVRLAKACSLIIASENAKFYMVLTDQRRLARYNRRNPRSIQETNGLDKDVSYISRCLDAKQAYQSGFVIDVVGESELINSAIVLAWAAIDREHDCADLVGCLAETSGEFRFAQAREGQPA